MDRARFDDYIRRFNERDATAFDEFIAPDMRMLNGGLEFTGVAGMREHYENRIWPHFEERLNVLRFVSSTDTLAIQMWARFTAYDTADTLFGPVEKGDVYDYRGVILYEIANEKFTAITVAYNSFINTKANGETVDLGMPH